MNKLMLLIRVLLLGAMLNIFPLQHISQTQIESHAQNLAGSAGPEDYVLSTFDGNIEAIDSMLKVINGGEDLVLLSPNDHFDGTVLDSSKWFDQSGNGGMISQNGSLIASTDGSQRSSNARVSSAYDFPGDFDIQVDYAIGAGWANTMQDYSSSGHLDGAALGIYAGSDWIHINRHRSDFYGPPPFFPMYQKANELMVYSSNAGWCNFVEFPNDISAATSGQYRIVRTGSLLSFYYGSGGGWTSLYSGSFSASPVRVYLDAAAINTKFPFTTSFDNFLVNSADISGGVRVTEHDFGQRVHLDSLSMDADIPAGTSIQANLYAMDTGDADWHSVGSYTFDAGKKDIQLPQDTYAEKVKYGISGTDGIKLVGTPDKSPVLHSLVLKTNAISHIEITQATQDETNSVPLIAGKPTFARVYVSCGSACDASSVIGELHGFGPSGELPGSPLASINKSIRAYNENWLDQRSDLGKTLNFTIPSAWRTGTLTLTAEVHLSGRTAEGSETVTFHPASAIQVHYVPIIYMGKSPDFARIYQGSWWANRIYPSVNIQYIPGPAIEWNDCLNTKESCSKEVVQANTIRLLHELTIMYNGEPGFVFGWLPYGTFNGGISDPSWDGGDGKAAFGDDGVEGPVTFAHEIGHLLNRRHSNTVANLSDEASSSNPEGCVLNYDPKPLSYLGTDQEWKAYVDLNSDWLLEDGPAGPPPFPNSKIQTYGLDGYSSAWLNTSSTAVKNPADVYDYMSYCGFQSKGNVWTSPWTYEHIYAQTQSGAAAGLKSPALLTSQTYFMASGLVYADDTAILDPGWVVTSSATPVNPPPGSQYCLEAQDVSGVPLTSYCFDLSFMNYETLEPSTVDGFSLMLPYPSGTDRIVLKKGTSELAVQPVTEHSPVVTVTSPNGGENWPATGAETITWTASDGDNNSLTYQVFYSPDGTNWIPLGGETTTTQITVNTAELAGSDAAYIRVMASDGVNTGSDESDGAFSVGRKVPQVNIITPEGSMTIFPDTPLWLQGYAYDLEDGMLGQGSLQWSSDRDGLLGKGSEALITLSPGLHHLTLSAQDSDGNTAYASISVFVGPKIYLPVIAVSH